MPIFSETKSFLDLWDRLRTWRKNRDPLQITLRLIEEPFYMVVMITWRYLEIEVTNTGRRPIILTGYSLTLENEYVVRGFHTPQKGPQFPYKLDTDDFSYRDKIHLASLAKALQRNDRSGTVNIRAVFRDREGTSYSSTPWVFDIDYWSSRT